MLFLMNSFSMGIFIEFIIFIIKFRLKYATMAQKKLIKAIDYWNCTWKLTNDFFFTPHSYQYFVRRMELKKCQFFEFGHKSLWPYNKMKYHNLLSKQFPIENIARKMFTVFPIGSTLIQNKRLFFTYLHILLTDNDWYKIRLVPCNLCPMFHFKLSKWRNCGK